VSARQVKRIERSLIWSSARRGARADRGHSLGDDHGLAVDAFLGEEPELVGLQQAVRSEKDDERREERNLHGYRGLRRGREKGDRKSYVDLVVS
jgi:hypothetical protein